MNPILGICYDIEDYNNDGHRFSSSMISKELYDAIIKEFMTTMNNNGYNAYIYTYYYYANNRFSDYARSYIGWMAQWSDNCQYTGYYHMWQYSSSLSVNGINGRVDGNVYFG